jgi:hypothetical protein
VHRAEAGEGVRQQHGATADGHDGQRVGGDPHAVHDVGDVGGDPVEGRGDVGRVEAGDQGAVADRHPARCHCDVGGGQDVAAEDESLLREAVADGVGPDGRVRAGTAHPAAAADADGQHVGHAEVGADAGHADLDGGLAGEAAGEHADVGGGAADVHDGARAQPGQHRRSAHRVGGPRGEGRHRVAAGELDVHERAVVLAEVEGRGDAVARDGGGQPVDDAVGELAQRGVDDRGVLALQQPHPADLVRERHRDVRAERRGDHLGGPDLELGVDRGEHRRDRDRPDAVRGHVLGVATQLGLVQRGDRPAVELVAAVREVGAPRDRLDQPLRPVDHRRQRRRGREPEPQRGRRGQVAGLHERVDEVRRADHDRLHLGRWERVLGLQAVQGGDDAGGDVRGRGGLHGGQHPVAVHEHGVGVGAPDVDPDPHQTVSLSAAELSSVRLTPTPRTRPSLPATT